MDKQNYKEVYRSFLWTNTLTKMNLRDAEALLSSINQVIGQLKQMISVVSNDVSVNLYNELVVKQNELEQVVHPKPENTPQQPINTF